MENNNDNNHNPPPPPQPTTVTAIIPPPPPPSGSSTSIGGISHHHNILLQQQQLQLFWKYQREEIEHVNDFKNHQLPLARIKKIMKADEDVRMISAEAPILFAKACELFILELTIRSWLHAEENKRRTLQKNDIAVAITRTEIFDFLVDIVPKEEVKEEEEAAADPVGAGVPYYYPPMSQPGMIGRPGMDPSGGYGQAWGNVWQNPAGGDDVSYGSGGSSGGGHGNLDNQS